MKGKIQIKKFIPRKIGNNKLNIKENKNKLIISYKSSGSPKQISLKKEIILDQSFFEIIGLYYGDGINTIKNSGIRQTGFINSCSLLHIRWIKFLEKLGLKKEELKARIQIGEYNKIPKKSLFNYWNENTKLPIESFSSKISIKKDNKTKKYGLLVISYNSKIFRIIFNNLFNFSLKLIGSDKFLSAHFIRGLFAAEGHVGTNKNKSTSYLSIPIKDEERRNYVESLFKRLGIKTTNDYERLDICGYLNFKIFKELRLYSLHPDKYSKFEDSFSHLVNYGRVPALTKLKIIDVLKKKNGITRYQISKLTNVGMSALHKNLRDLEIKGIVIRSGKSTYGNHRKLRDIWNLVKIPEDKNILTYLDYCKN